MQRFLVVDDNAIERTLYQTIISYHFDCSHIDFAVNGVEALEESLKNDYSAIIVDIEMPRMNGIDFFERLKRNSPQKAEKIIFSSANIDNHKKTFFNKEDCPYLTKPFSRIELLHLINNTIERNKRVAVQRDGVSRGRKHLRTKVLESCIIKCGPDKAFFSGNIEARILDHSKGGLSLLCDKGEQLKFEKGEEIIIFADKLDISNKRAEVVWSKSLNEGIKTGLKWL